MKLVSLVLAVLSFCVIASAQEMPPEPVAAAPLSGVFDRKFVALAVTSVAMNIADVELTHSCLVKHTCSEGNPLLGRSPSRARMYGFTVPVLTVGILMSAHFRKKAPDKKAWIIPMLSVCGGKGVVIGLGLTRR